MKNTHRVKNRVAACAAVVLLAVCLTVCAASGALNASKAFAAESPTFTPLEPEITLNFNAERGASFDFAVLPAKISLMGRLSDVKGMRTLDVEVEWRITDEAAAQAARSEDFTIYGELAGTEYGDVAYGIAGDTALTAAVLFVDRSATTGMTFNIVPAYKYGTETLVMLNMLASFDSPFDKTGVTGLELQYSFGDGWQSLSVPADELKELNGTNLQVEFINADFAYEEDPYVFTETELKRFLTDLVHFRVKITGGLFDGFTNSVTLDGDKNKVNENEAGSGGESGILPDYYHGGSRGGAIAFWMSPGGTALAVTLGVLAAAVCFGGGLAVGIVLYRRRKKREEDKP